MSGEELQDDSIIEVDNEVIADDQDSEQFESEDSGSEDDLAPSDEGQHHKKVEFTPEQQEVMNREIGKKTFKLREAERNAKALEQELRSIKAEREKVAAPVIAPMPSLMKGMSRRWRLAIKLLQIIVSGELSRL